MKERPILFSAPMVKAILAGTKTQTRRIVNNRHTQLEWVTDTAPGIDPYLRLYRPDGSGPVDVTSRWLLSCCPYGQPGDRLWVKETFVSTTDGKNYVYRADARDRAGYRWHSITPGDKDVRWKPSIFCTRKASRITLEIVNVRVERLQDISEADAKAEGVHLHGTTRFASECREAYRALWESINGPGSWAENPWVWVVEFRRVEK